MAYPARPRQSARIVTTNVKESVEAEVADRVTVKSKGRIAHCLTRQAGNRRMPNGTYGGVGGRKTKIGQKTYSVFRPTRFVRPHRTKCVLAHHFLAADDIDAVGQGVEVFRGSGSAAVEMVDGHSLAVGHNGRDAALCIFFYDFVITPRIGIFIQFLCSLGHVDDFEGIAVPSKDAFPCTARFRWRHTANVEIGQLPAIAEASASQIRYGGGKRDGDQICATLEAVICQSFNGVRYLGLHTAGNEGVGSSFYDGIASLARIVEGVTLFYRHTVYGFTPLKTWLYNSLMVLGSVTEARLMQPQNVLLVDYQYYTL